MATATTKAGAPGGIPAFSQGSDNVFGIVLRYLGLMVLNAMALIIAYALFDDGDPYLAVVIIIITLFANIVILIPDLYPFKWMAPGLMLMMLLVIYPIIYTVITSLTNYGDGHLLPKNQTIELIERRRFVSEDAPQYSWQVYQSEDGSYALWLTATEGNETVWAREGETLEVIDDPPAEAPASFEGYTLLDRAGRAQALQAIQNTIFGEGDDTAGILNRNVVARPLQQRYEYNTETDTIFDIQEQRTYTANGELGYFLPPSGNVQDALAPGYRVFVGLDNFTRLVEDPALRGPLIDIFLWTVTFALLSVLTSFSMGLFFALILNDKSMPFKPIIRSLMLIPYATPGVISILIWRGLLNQELGLINDMLESIGWDAVRWFGNPWWAKFAVILVNMWLSYSYFMLICSGALQAIPSEVYEAAAVDGARTSQRFWRITLPLLLITVGPLLIASFTYAFNNYLMIEALTQGDPPNPNSPIPVGHTDILINYTYNAAFGNSRGADYGYASALAIIIFGITAVITLIQFQLTGRWEEVSESV